LPPVPPFEARPLGVGLAAIVLFGVALQWLGLIAAAAVLVLVGAYAARDVRPLETLALAGVMVLFSVAVFVWLLGLPIPLWPEW
jgi:putative tricarboxylic transport membrane protein